MAVADKDLYLKIGKPNNKCTKCGVAITHAGKHASVLLAPGEVNDTPEKQPVDGQLEVLNSASDNTPRREDYCADCWQQISGSDFIGYWQARREPPKTRKIESRKERNAGVLAWFNLLRTQKLDNENLQAQFFLAHLLMKYGVLKWVRTETDSKGRELIFFRQTGTEDYLEVIAVELSDETTLDIKLKLDEFLLQFANSGEVAPDAPAQEQD